MAILRKTRKAQLPNPNRPARLVQRMNARSLQAALVRLSRQTRP
jgi:hypothetical protein